MTKNQRYLAVFCLGCAMMWVSISVVQTLATKHPITACLTSSHMVDCE
jgi:hypothetical protein